MIIWWEVEPLAIEQAFMGGYEMVEVGAVGAVPGQSPQNVIINNISTKRLPRGQTNP